MGIGQTMGWYPLWNYVKNSYLFDKFVIELVIAIKSGQLGGNADTFMPMFSADALDFLFLVTWTDIFLEERIVHFFLVT